MFSGRHKLATDDTGSVPLNRSPKYFDYVLEYLRNGGVLPPLPSDKAEVQRIKYVLCASCACAGGVTQNFSHFVHENPPISAQGLGEKAGVPNGMAPSISCLELSSKHLLNVLLFPVCSKRGKINYALPPARGTSRMDWRLAFIVIMTSKATC